MKYLIKVSSDKRTVISTVEGKFDKKSYLSVRNKIFNLLKSTNAKYVLLDLRRVIMNASTIEVFRMASSVIETFPLGIKYAIVYSEKTTTEENAKFGETVAVNRGGLVKVFRDISEAKKWLIIPEVTHENNTPSLRNIYKTAERGDADAQNNLGWMYQNGEGVPQDNVEAVKWYHKAAEQGHVDAQNNLGWMYHNGKGIPQDHTKALRFYHKAAKRGNAYAKLNLGWIYGEGDLLDHTESAKWFLKAAKQGIASAQFKLYLMYSEGKGFEQDNTKAAKWYSKAILNPPSSQMPPL